MKRDFTRLLDVTQLEAAHLLERAAFLKKVRKMRGVFKPLTNRVLAMIFEKASTRTRISFEIGMKELGGEAIFLPSSETQMGRGEPIRDTARVLERYVDAIMIRTYGQETVDELARWAKVPVINGLSDLCHPCQILADIFTIQEFKGDLQGLKIAYIGDGNNVANSWLEASILFGLSLTMATPAHYRPNEELLERAQAKERFVYTHDPAVAASEADVVNTDVWVSMGMEKEKEERKKAFAPFCIDRELLKKAKGDVIVMHCLPAYRNQEISEEVFERFHEIIFTQAENRLHVQKALLEWLVEEV